ncbi:hypothetical protein M4D51_07850 [Microbacterium sp. p3-SID338]|uniref:hypothetical protein n=1 Tax=Microbacterium sp. p3-SID338 TaxID=2916214 RepID=UPI0021A3F38F|nr:hypothetical protein [Microbacterium sp. p3-SID338]MCT1395638.1 hypothetical protein [Microbacterium sp. p3-SID338]
MTTATIEPGADLSALTVLREPFKPEQIDKLPKPASRDAQKGRCNECGGYHGLPAVHLDYVGHAQVTARLLDVDPAWSWEPVAIGDNGLPVFDQNGGLWIRLTVGGVTRLGYGDSQGKNGPNAVKEAIGDALRNAAMRFGVALDLWSKSDIHSAVEQSTAREWVIEAQAADGVDAIRDIWKQARAAGADVDTLDKITVLAQERMEGGV